MLIPNIPNILQGGVSNKTNFICSMATNWNICSCTSVLSACLYLSMLVGDVITALDLHGVLWEKERILAWVGVSITEAIQIMKQNLFGFRSYPLEGGCEDGGSDLIEKLWRN